MHSVITDVMQNLSGHVVSAWMKQMASGDDFSAVQKFDIWDDLMVTCNEVEFVHSLSDSLLFCQSWFSHLDDIKQISVSSEGSKSFEGKHLVNLLAVVDAKAFNVLYVSGEVLSELQKQSILSKVTVVNTQIQDLLSSRHSAPLNQLAVRVVSIETSSP